MLGVEELTEKQQQYCCRVTSKQFRGILLQEIVEEWEALKGR
jgi:hypothetical protein